LEEHVTELCLLQLTSALKMEVIYDVFHQNVNWFSLDCTGFFPEDRTLYVSILIFMCSWPMFNMTFFNLSRFWNSTLKYVTNPFFPVLSGSLFTIILSPHSTLYYYLSWYRIIIWFTDHQCMQLRSFRVYVFTAYLMFNSFTFCQNSAVSSLLCQPEVGGQQNSNCTHSVYHL
jgi:hypothetical protein